MRKLIYYLLIVAIVLEATISFTAEANQESKRARKNKRARGQPKIRRTIRMRESNEATTTPQSTLSSDDNSIDLSNVGPTNQLEMNPEISVQAPQQPQPQQPQPQQPQPQQPQPQQLQPPSQRIEEPIRKLSRKQKSVRAAERPSQPKNNDQGTVTEEPTTTSLPEVPTSYETVTENENLKQLELTEQTPVVAEDSDKSTENQAQPASDIQLKGYDNGNGQHLESAPINNSVAGSTNNISLNVEGPKNEQSSAEFHKHSQHFNGPHPHTCQEHPHHHHDENNVCQHPSHRERSSYKQAPSPPHQVNININGGEQGTPPRQKGDYHPSMDSFKFIVPLINNANLAQAVMSGHGIEQALTMARLHQRQPNQFMLVQPAPFGGYMAQPVAMMSPLPNPYLGAPTAMHQMAPAILHPSPLMGAPMMTPYMAHPGMMMRPFMNGHPAMPTEWMIKPNLGGKNKKGKRGRRNKSKNKNKKNKNKYEDELDAEDERDDEEDDEEYDDDDAEEVTTTTQAPTTAEPTTAEPTTPAPTTAAPITAVPMILESVIPHSIPVRSVERILVPVPTSTETETKKDDDHDEEIIWKTVQVPERKKRSKKSRRRNKKD